MSSPFLSRQDIESWVPDAAASKSSVGFVAKLSTSIGRAMASLRKSLFELQDEACRASQDELDRFLLWCQGVGVADGHLDDILSQSNELHRQVLSLLLRLGSSVLQVISQILGQPSRLQLDDCDHLKALLNVVETMLRESDSDEHERPDTPSGSDSSDYGLVETMEEISAYVDCLLDLAPALDNPVLDIQANDAEKPRSRANESFTTSCEEALVYCRKIRDSFDTLPKYLVERLAEANVVRAAKIREIQYQATEKGTPANDGITESLFSDKHPQITDTTKSKQWKRHVFHDLKPGIWAEHESSHSSATSTSSVCVFCSANYQELGPAYYKHVSGHLREVSLSVLPQTTDEDEKSSTDDTGSLPQYRSQAGEDQIIEAGGYKPGVRISIPLPDIKFLCAEGRAVLQSQPVLLELLAPINVVGDIHGQFYDLLRMFNTAGFPPQSNYLFLGNYVDYGQHSLEVMCLLLAYKIKYPENFFLLRGNHEAASVNRDYGFYSECEQRYSISLWKDFVDMFNYMPLAAIVSDKVLCVHGGLSPDLLSMEQIREIERPIDIPDTGLVCDLVWSDYDADIVGWSESERGVSFTFGPDVVRRFLAKWDMDLIVRGSQVVDEGYQLSSDRQLVTLWTAPDWRGFVLCISE
ncbi:hypothetical protein BHE90_004858 [Fusarium euwallaceae]|uniref:Serine/threonine-protein phosphatase n=1 Tax=Fusarium euwallaceae TaxID=1147111 RepID=A0A430LY38_9HYPO|nr:hypothetical protein BHE90_004858 [Fusarium euwallaceae]